MADNIVVLGSIVTVVATIIGSAIVLSKIPAERRKLDADTMESYAAAVRSYGDEVRELRMTISVMQTEIDDLRSWAEELAAQLRKAGIEPAPFKRRAFK